MRSLFLGYCAIILAIGWKKYESTPVPASINTALKSASAGSIIDLSALKMDQTNDILNSAASNMEFATTGGYLIYSDDPETVKGYGILYQDTIPMEEAARIYIYHVNGYNSAAKITAVLKNPSPSSNVTISYLRKSLVTPSSDYLAVGAAGVKAFYDTTSFPVSFVLQPGSTALLDAALDVTKVGNEALLSATYDIASSQSDVPLQVTISMLPTSANTLKDYASYGVAVKDGYHRLGTFGDNKKTNTAGGEFEHRLSVGAKYFEIASNLKYTSNDKPLSGISAYDNSTVSLNGNYGVEYQLTVSVTNDLSTSAKYAVVLNPRGGTYLGYIRINGGATQYIPSVSTSSEGAVCGFVTLAPNTQAPTNVKIEFIPAGSTSLPVWLLLLPVV